MSRYRRFFVPGGTYFFTLVTAGRRPWLGTRAGRLALGQAMRAVRADQPFETIAIVALPDHLHAVWKLPEGDADFPRRWRRIKQRTTRRLRRDADLQGPIWQSRFWEHWIRDEEDLRRHVEYVHYNPVRHGLVDTPADWAASSFHRFVREGVHPAAWDGPTDPIEVPE